MDKNARSLAAHLTMASSYWPYYFSVSDGADTDLPGYLRSMLLGMRRYQEHNYTPQRLPLQEIWRAGNVSVNCIPEYSHRDDCPTLILIPSLINRAYILDLLPGRSLMRWLVEKNINAYLLDWGQSNYDDGQADIESAILQRLVPAIEFVAQRSGDKISALGYCMGGTLLAGAAISAGNYIKSLVFLASPWDFHGGTQGLLKRVKLWAPSVFPVIDERGYLPLDLIQILFASLDPDMTAKKFSNFIDMEAGSEQEKLFITVEDWLGDGVDLPAAIAQQCIGKWFLENQTFNGEWAVGGHIVHPEDIECPALVIASENDRLVEMKSSLGLHDGLQNSQLLNPACGHIGMIAGRNSLRDVWEPIAKFINSIS